MGGGRTTVVAAVVVLVIGVAGVGYQQVVRPPRPHLPYPAGQSLQSVRGNCRDGNELAGCDPKGGPRSFVTVRAGGDRRADVQALFGSLVRAGWHEDAAGATARDFAGGGAPEDLQPLYCRTGAGCVGLFRFVPQGYVLAWFDKA